jgi:hypothetical protein
LAVTFTAAAALQQVVGVQQGLVVGIGIAAGDPVAGRIDRALDDDRAADVGVDRQAEAAGAQHGDRAGAGEAAADRPGVWIP